MSGCLLNRTAFSGKGVASQALANKQDPTFPVRDCNDPAPAGIVNLHGSVK